MQKTTFPPSKKRAAGVQLSWDNPSLDDDEDTSEGESGTFKSASDEVLAARRIVKVHCQQTLTPSAPAAPASNPFAAIRLVPPASSPLMPCSVRNKETEPIDKIDSKSVNAVDDPNGESTTDAKPSESKVSKSKVEISSEKDESHVVDEQSVTRYVTRKVTEGENSGNGAEEATEDDSRENEARKDAEGKKIDKGECNGEVTTDKSAETASFSSFQQLSSSQNAFPGFTGTGFSSISFSFGSIPKKRGSTGFCYWVLLLVLSKLFIYPISPKLGL